jgi:16S rRNA (adenine1518-N6/adenine1519-N6)-dimethyltransferase
MNKRKLGQNFLIDKDVAYREIEYANVKSDDVVLEIGPGNGILTKILAKKAKKVIAIEIDKKYITKMKYFLPDNVLLIHDDALKTDFESIPKFNKIVSNLPYQISSPMTFKFLNYDFFHAVVIYQKEFAERMVARFGDKKYSRLSVGIYYKSETDILEYLPRYCFDPIPKVDSCIVKIKPRKNPVFKVYDENLFFEITTLLFNHRRKKIKNILNSKYGIESEKIPYKEKRVGELSPEDIGNIANAVYSIVDC